MIKVGSHSDIAFAMELLGVKLIIFWTDKLKRKRLRLELELSVVECTPSMHGTLGSRPTTTIRDTERERLHSEIS